MIIDKKKVTLAVPVFNEEKTIYKSLISLHFATKQIENPVEFLICFNGTTDDSKQEVAKFSKKYQKIRIIECEKGKARAIKALGEHAHGNIIVFTDADAIMDKNCLKNILKKYTDQKIKAVTGRPVPWSRNGFLHHTLNARMLHPEAEIARNPVYGNRDKPFLHGRLYSVRKELFLKPNTTEKMKFSIGDDTYLTHLIVKKYGRNSIVCAKDAHTRYLAVQSITSWWRKWSRIWRDLDLLYQNNPSFSNLKQIMKTKIDWRYVATLPIQTQISFVFERIIHKTGRILYGLIKPFKKITWIRLDDTKEVPV